MEQVYKEIGRKPRDEERRSYHFKHLREMKDKANKKERLMKQYQQQLDDADDPFKSGRVVRYLAYFCGVVLVGLILAVAKDSSDSGVDVMGGRYTGRVAPPAARPPPGYPAGYAPRDAPRDAPVTRDSSSKKDQ